MVVNKHAVKPTPASRRPSTALSMNLAGNLAKGLLSVFSLQVPFCKARGRLHATRLSGRSSRTAPRSQAIANRVAVLVNACVMQCMFRATQQQRRCAKHKDDELGPHPGFAHVMLVMTVTDEYLITKHAKCLFVTLSTLYPIPHPRIGIHLPVSI